MAYKTKKIKSLLKDTQKLRWRFAKVGLDNLAKKEGKIAEYLLQLEVE